jgi:phage terminase Nu1 subunit (DNA packaging protein)
MAKPKQPKQDPWCAKRQADVARFFGVSVDTVKNWAKQGMPGKSPAYPLDDIAQWLRRDGPWQPHARHRGVDDELEDEAEVSEGLERYRLAKAALAELELAERQHQLVSVERIREGLLRWSVILKRAGERLRKRFGTDAHRVVTEALAECGRVIDDEFAKPADQAAA